VGWFGVDAFGIPAGIRDDDLALVHAHIARLAAELIDDKTMLLYLPASNRIGEPTARNTDLLRRGAVGEVFGDDSLHAPIVNVSNDDKAVEKAKQEARRRLPELLTAFDAGRAQNAMIKAGFAVSRNGETGTEYIWIMLTSVEDDGLAGTLANPPLDPAIGKKGGAVKVPSERVVDWAYVDEKKKPRGLFVERLLTAAR
ncbi:MAG TPA: DUF2314 domain-containing protein, partial [Phycisphaerales bacterium]|nr:DUF2314 domain-containing protein [Phycisphaerales bacterium]